MKGLAVTITFLIMSHGFSAEISKSCLEKLSGEKLQESDKIVFGDAKRANPGEIEARVKKYRAANKTHHQGLVAAFELDFAPGCERILKKIQSEKKNHIFHQYQDFMKFLDHSGVGSDMLRRCKEIDKAFAGSGNSKAYSSAISNFFIDKREKALSNVLGKAAAMVEKDFDSAGIPKEYNSVQQVQSGSTTFTVYSLNNKIVSVARRGEFQEASGQIFEMAPGGECQVSKIHQGKVTMDLDLCDEFKGYEKDIKSFNGNYFPISYVEVLLKQKQNPKDPELKKSADEIREIMKEGEYNSVLRIGSYLSKTKNKFHKDQFAIILNDYLHACEEHGPSEARKKKKSSTQSKRF